MPRTKTVAVTFSRFTDDDQEYSYTVKCEVTPGSPGTRLDPPEDPETAIVSITADPGAPALTEDDLDPSEVEKIDEMARDEAAQADDDYEEDR